MGEQLRRCEMVFSKDEMERFHVEEGLVMVDVHGMNCRQAKRFLKNVIALFNGKLIMEVIHGYNNGHAIKDMIRHDQISDRIIRTEPVDWNPGMTRLVLA